MARIVRAKTPSAYLPAFAQVDWARAAEGETGAAFDPAQVARLESLVRALGERENLKALLGQVLDALLLWTGVERGLLLLCAPDGRLVPRAARNLGRHDLEGEQLALSQSIARRALEIRDAVVATDAYSSLGDVHASVHALRLRSVLAVPLVARGDALGVVYLDDRVRRGAFGENELAWVRVLSAQAALAIADARDQALLRRANRRAERAQKKLLTRLAHADAELDATRIQLAQARDESQTRYAYDAIVGRSEPMQELLRVVDRVTPVDVPVLLVGESGTGKELIARAIHENGPRSARPFVGENCGAVPEPLLESTLFGHVRGAFTGAVATRAGLFEVADGGTLFLDEIGEMPLAMQTKLLRVLQDGEVRPVGSEKARKVNVRIVAATHRDLSAMAQEGLFREDLLYRLSVIVLRVPPLRERRDDIPLLVASFLDRHGGGQGQVRISRAALDRLVAYPWPGNVRQLENEVRRAIVLSDGRIEEEHLSPALQESARASVKSHGLDLRSRIDALEVDLLREALRKTQGNQTKAAALLGVSRYGLQKMIKRLNVRVPS
jgi:transcriptional regulator with GAF, ATPase, and Fis domain